MEHYSSHGRKGCWSVSYFAPGTVLSLTLACFAFRFDELEQLAAREFVLKVLVFDLAVLTSSSKRILLVPGTFCSLTLPDVNHLRLKPGVPFHPVLLEPVALVPHTVPRSWKTRS